MKNLPDSFQFRDKSNAGFTHSCKRNAHGDYEVKWARGWAECIDEVPWRVAYASEVDKLVSNGSWIVVEDTPKQKDFASSLPDEFYFKVFHGEVYRFAKINAHKYMCHALKDDDDCAPWSVEDIKQNLKSGVWTILDKRPLTAEQQRQVKEFREQIDALASSIRIQEQTVEHHTRMIANYQSRQDDLHEKIAELTGEDSPNIVKAKEMKAELDKLKKGNV
jgi:hypothetical protein